jgi:membrane-associated phospholipid phosphatase
MKNIENTFDILGFYGPIVIAVIVCIVLRTRPKYVFLYIIFLVLNDEFNKILKLIFRENRPENPIPFLQIEKYEGVQSYGMPSGHAQSVAYSCVFLYMLSGVSYWLYISLFIAILTCVQRWKYRRHSVEQIMVGVVCGIFVAYSVIYWL